jgi:hypothetical protein
MCRMGLKPQSATIKTYMTSSFQSFRSACSRRQNEIRNHDADSRASHPVVLEGKDVMVPPRRAPAKPLAFHCRCGSA